MTSFIARSPVDLLAVVPYAIGFHPEESVVLITFGHAVEQFHARVDLPVTPREQEQVAAILDEVIRRRGSAQVGVLLYTEDAGAARALHDVLVPRLLRAGVEIVDVLRVAGDRFHPAEDPGDPGTPYDLSAHPYTAAQVVEGRVAHGSREALADTLIGTDDHDRAAVMAEADAFADHLVAVGRASPRRRSGGRPSLATALSGELRDQGRWIQSAIRTSLGATEPGMLTTKDAGRLLVLVALETMREVVLAEMTRASAAGHVDLWRQLLRRAPRDLRAAPASLCAFAAWLNGEGALAWCALELCFEVDSDDRLGHHVAALLETATPPSVWVPIPQGALHVFSAVPERSGRRR